jgi:2-methylcitrate dehydratase PrpD
LPGSSSSTRRRKFLRGVEREGAPDAHELARLRDRRGAASHARCGACRGERARAVAAGRPILGRSERVDIASAALLNGISSHTFDFDDTHFKTIIHPAGPVASAAVALGEHIGSTGRELIDALILGIDVACRVGNMIYPDHYDRGWHITGSTGMLGAAAACARLFTSTSTGRRWRSGSRRRSRSECASSSVR